MDLIVLENVSTDFRVGHDTIPAVRNVTLAVARGTFVSIVGHSGSGKTTLLSLIGAMVTRELQIDRVEGLAEDTDATLKLGDVPVAYLPTFSFPIDDRRRSGFLVPRLGFSSSRGVEFRVPYYFNLAPNYDATLTPGYLSKRGPVLGAEFRHMTDTSQSMMRGEILPEDQERPDLGVRGALSVQHRQYWGALSADVNFNQASDDFYLTDFGRSFTQSSMRYLTRRASVGYAGDDWRVSALVSDYQSVDPTVDPYRLLPSIVFAGRHQYPIADQPFELGVGASYTNSPVWVLQRQWRASVCREPWSDSGSSLRDAESRWREPPSSWCWEPTASVLRPQDSRGQ